MFEPIFQHEGRLTAAQACGARSLERVPKEAGLPPPEREQAHRGLQRRLLFGGGLEGTPGGKGLHEEPPNAGKEVRAVSWIQLYETNLP